MRSNSSIEQIFTKLARPNLQLAATSITFLEDLIICFFTWAFSIVGVVIPLSLSTELAPHEGYVNIDIFKKI
jgi:hypothetical protein